MKTLVMQRGKAVAGVAERVKERGGDSWQVTTPERIGTGDTLEEAVDDAGIPRDK